MSASSPAGSGTLSPWSVATNGSGDTYAAIGANSFLVDQGSGGNRGSCLSVHVRASADGSKLTSHSSTRRPFLPHPKSFNSKIVAGSGNSLGLEESSLVRELNELSFKERESALEELHGVAQLPPQENSESLAQLREEMATALELVPKLKRRVWERAVWLRPSLYKDQKLFNMFLRADRYDPAKAACRLCKYFHHKLELFGEDSLVRNITLQDLSPDDLDAMRIEGFECKKMKDRAGRYLVSCNLTRVSAKHWTNTARQAWYRIMTHLLEHEESQIYGMVDIHFCQFEADDEERSWRFMELIQGVGDIVMASLPFWNPGCHFVYDSPLLHPAMKLVQIVNGKNKRARTRYHYGSIQEVRYKMIQFGIPPEAVRTPSVQENEKYIEERWREEREIESRIISFDDNGDPEFVLYPGPKDVLLGRGASYQTYSGNVRLAELIDEFRDEYYGEESDRLQKTYISQKIIRRILDEGGFFFKRTDNGWESVDIVTARDKVSHLFRSKPRPKSRPQSTQQI